MKNQEINTSQCIIQPPVGYLGINYSFPNPNPQWGSTRKQGCYNFDCDFSLGSQPDTRVGTFLSFNATFNHSSGNLPAYHVGGNQGGYFGVQVKSPGEYIAIFSIWWALDAVAGAWGETKSEVEAWYVEGNPWKPGITGPPWPDSGRKWAGGPFKSCRTPITLKENSKYRMRIWELGSTEHPTEPEWWGCWLIDLNSNEEQFIGKIQVPASWGWLDGTAAGGFMEYFDALPEGCASIPSSATTVFNAKANNSGQIGSTSVNLYGACLDALKARTTIESDKTGCTIKIV